MYLQYTCSGVVLIESCVSFTQFLVDNYIENISQWINQYLYI